MRGRTTDKVEASSVTTHEPTQIYNLSVQTDMFTCRWLLFHLGVLGVYIHLNPSDPYPSSSCERVLPGRFQVTKSKQAQLDGQGIGIIGLKKQTGSEVMSQRLWLYPSQYHHPSPRSGPLCHCPSRTKVHVIMS